MIDLSGCISIPYLKKAVFTGSYGKMRYLIEKVQEEETVLKACYWEGPYASQAVSDEKKTAKIFPFSQEGISQAVAWLNEASATF